MIKPFQFADNAIEVAKFMIHQLVDPSNPKALWYEGELGMKGNFILVLI